MSSVELVLLKSASALSTIVSQVPNVMTMIVQNRTEIVRIVSIAIILFTLSELVHKALFFTDTWTTVADIFVVISRIMIFIWMSLKLSLKINLLPFFGLVFMLSFFEYIFLGSISLLVLSLIEKEFLLVHGLIGLSVTFPVVLTFALILSGVVFIISSKLKSRNRY